jgi:hypothetical protein
MKPLHVGLSCIGVGALVVALALVPRQSAAGAGAPSPLDLAEGPVIRELPAGSPTLVVDESGHPRNSPFD